MKLTISVPTIFKYTFFAIIIGFCISACKKPNNDTSCKLSILIVDTLDMPQSGAEVRVYVDTSLLSNKSKIPTGVPKTQTTGSDGRTTFNFSFGIMVNVDAATIIHYPSPAKPDTTQFETTFAQMDDGQTLEKRIKLRRH